MKIEKKYTFTSTPANEKERRNLELYELLKERHTISRAELSHITGINAVSISNYIKDYIEKNLAFESGVDVSTGGRRPELIELNVKGAYAVGVELGGAVSRAAVTDLAMRAVGKESGMAPSGGADPVADAACAIDALLKKSGIPASEIRAIGISVNKGDHAAIAKEIEDHFKIDTFCGGAALCAAFGEHELNAKAGVDGLLYLYSGLGSGAWITKNSIMDYEAANDERAGYLRPWGGELGLAHNAKAETLKGVGTSMAASSGGDPEKISEKTVIDSAVSGDGLALSLLRTAILALGLRAAYLVNLLGPKVIALGGGIEKAGELVIGPLRNMVKRFSLSNLTAGLEIIPVSLGEDAVSQGAASLAVRELFLNA